MCSPCGDCAKDPGVGSAFTGESITRQHSVHGQQAWEEPIHPCLDPGGGRKTSL